MKVEEEAKTSVCKEKVLYPAILFFLYFVFIKI